MSSAILLDGSERGGAAIIPAALSLSLATGKSFAVERAGGPQGAGGAIGPALAGTLRAAQAVSGGRLEGGEVGDRALAFAPGFLRAGHYLLDAGPQGSVSELVSTLAVPLGLAGGPSTLKLTGLTHGGGAPAVPWLARVWRPALAELGADLELGVDAAGFAPEAGGEVTLEVRPARAACPLERRSRGTLCEARVVSTVSNLAFEAACRQSERALQRLREAGVYAEAENVPLRAPRSKGLSCLVLAVFERGRAGFCAHASSETDAERVADEAAGALASFLRGWAAVDEALATRLLVPLGLAAAGLQGGSRVVSRLSVARVSDELLGVAALVERFLDVEVAVLTAPAGSGGTEADVRVAPRESGLLAALRGKRGW